MRLVETMLRSDHLEAVIKYALEQTDSGGGEINPLAWGDNENAIGEYTASSESAYEEIKSALEGMLLAVQAAKAAGHCDLLLIPRPTHYNSPTVYRD